MKKSMLAALAAVVVATSVQAQSTVDSIASKYKLQPMPAARTMEQAFPVIGSYQLQNSTEGTGTVMVNLDPSNKGVVWVEGLPQGKIKAYLKKSPTTYRILSQKSESGKQVQEGTLHYDTASHELHIALGKAFDESDPTGIFALMPDMSSGAMQEGETETKIKSGDTKMKTEVEGNQVKVKTKTGTTKNKTKVQFYTATKVMQNHDMMGNDTMNNSTINNGATNNTQTQQSDSTGTTQEQSGTSQDQ
jgi:hypothetical protein